MTLRAWRLITATHPAEKDAPWETTPVVPAIWGREGLAEGSTGNFRGKDKMGVGWGA